MTKIDFKIQNRNKGRSLFKYGREKSGLFCDKKNRNKNSLNREEVAVLHDFYRSRVSKPETSVFLTSKNKNRVEVICLKHPGN